jgi:hypothetical protein
MPSTGCLILRNSKRLTVGFAFAYQQGIRSCGRCNKHLQAGMY